MQIARVHYRLGVVANLHPRPRREAAHDRGALIGPVVPTRRHSYVVLKLPNLVRPRTARVHGHVDHDFAAEGLAERHTTAQPASVAAATGLRRVLDVLRPNADDDALAFVRGDPVVLTEPELLIAEVRHMA